MVQKIFGSKFHITFPNRRRREDSTCGVGVWPTNQQNRYQTLGVDVRISYHSDVSNMINSCVWNNQSKKLFYLKFKHNCKFNVFYL